MLFCRKIEDQSNSLNSVILCNISVRPGNRARFLETHGWQVWNREIREMKCSVSTGRERERCEGYKREWGKEDMGNKSSIGKVD